MANSEPQEQAKSAYLPLPETLDVGRTGVTFSRADFPILRKIRATPVLARRETEFYTTNGNITRAKT